MLRRQAAALAFGQTEEHHTPHGIARLRIGLRADQRSQHLFGQELGQLGARGVLRQLEEHAIQVDQPDRQVARVDVPQMDDQRRVLRVELFDEMQADTIAGDALVEHLAAPPAFLAWMRELQKTIRWPGGKGTASPTPKGKNPTLMTASRWPNFIAA